MPEVLQPPLFQEPALPQHLLHLALLTLVTGATPSKYIPALAFTMPTMPRGRPRCIHVGVIDKVSALVISFGAIRSEQTQCLRQLRDGCTSDCRSQQ